MRCEELNENLEAYIDGELDAGRSGEVEAHLAGCSACREEMVRAKRIVFELRDLPARKCPESVAGRVLNRIGQADERRQARPPGLFRRNPLTSWPLRAAAGVLPPAMAATDLVWKAPATQAPAYSREEIDRARKGIALAFGCVDHSLDRAHAVVKKENVPGKIIRPLKRHMGSMWPLTRKGEEG